EDVSGGRSPLCWSVVESVPVHEDIKRAVDGCEKYISASIETMKNLAACDVKTICYNFMPVIDWTRTDLDFRLPTGASALRFDFTLFSAFDLFILKRTGAEGDYTDAERTAAAEAFKDLSEEEKELLSRNITAGLPGRMTDSYDIEEFRKALAQYDGIDREILWENLCRFLEAVLPEAERLGIKLAIHPDDPPRELLGLPRVICTPDDLEKLFERLPSPANGITLCVGTYGSHPDNDLPQMAKQFAARIYFAHLRGVKKDHDNPWSFYEASHLDSDVDIITVIENLLVEEARRGGDDIPVRPDHGHRMLDDLNKTVNPGYSAIGRLKGLAEIRGVIRTLLARR
ncbi:MAG: mannonate dehydratase, partial [Emcibacter sp.]|nr:mannonate dehydratase [Emcibacter sp.]